MKRIFFVVLLLQGLFPLQAQRLTSFRPGELWPDNKGVHINAHGGGILYHHGTYYWYGEHKVAGGAGNTAQVGVRCYSSRDLYNWRDEGIVLPVSDDPKNDIAKGCILERPKVIYCKKTGRYVMWFHLERLGHGYDDALVGVAQARKPTGPFEYVHSFRCCPGHWPINVLPLHKKPVPEALRQERSNLNAGEHPDSVNTVGRDFVRGQQSRDMTLFVDDDGKAYHVSSSESNSAIHISELTDDYLGLTGKWVRAFAGQHLEGPALFKHNGLYYMMASWCSGWAPNAAHSAVAPSIWGPWTEMGNPCPDKGKETTYESQSTYILPIPGQKDKYIYMGDRWRPDNAIDGRYVWLPLTMEGSRFLVHWKSEWKW